MHNCKPISVGNIVYGEWQPLWSASWEENQVYQGAAALNYWWHSPRYGVFAQYEKYVTPRLEEFQCPYRLRLQSKAVRFRSFWAQEQKQKAKEEQNRHNPLDGTRSDPQLIDRFLLRCLQLWSYPVGNANWISAICQHVWDANHRRCWLW